MTRLTTAEVCSLAPVIPVIVIDDAAHAAPLAQALVAGGLRALEVTLRTPVALEAIRIMSEAAPEAVVGAGTLRTPADVVSAVEAGARFGVSPGLSHAALDAAEGEGLPMMPGVATPSEAMAAAERGLEVLKFFPAEANGGVETLKAWAGPLVGLKFCPTGGVTASNAKEYLMLPNVICVGGSWVASKSTMLAKNWDKIQTVSSAATAIDKAIVC